MEFLLNSTEWALNMAKGIVQAAESSKDKVNLATFFLKLNFSSNLFCSMTLSVLIFGPLLASLNGGPLMIELAWN